MNEITTFNFEGHEIRTVNLDGEIGFVGRDVCQRLGYANETDAMNRHCRGVVKRYPIVDSLGRTQETRVLSEPDVLRLIVNSKLPEAQKFEAWVFEEVLPTIHKTGAYVHPKARQSSPLKTLTDAARAFAAVRKTIKEIGCNDNAATISANQVIQKTVGINLLEMAGQTHLIATNQNEQYYTPTELGKMCGLSGREVNKLLEQDGLQVNIAGRWEPTEKGRPHCVILDTGKKHSSGVPVTQIKWVPSVMQAYITTETA